MKRSLVTTAAVAAVSVLLLTGCQPTSASGPETADMAVVGEQAPAGMPMDGSTGTGEMTSPSVDVRDPASVMPEEQRAVIRSASGFLSVPDLPKARQDLSAIIAKQGGTVISEYARSGYQTPPPVYYDQYYGGVTYPAYEYEQYVDVVFTVPEDRYADAIAEVRGLGEVISVTQNATDVTTQVVDTEARIRAARASVERIEALLGEATTLDETLRLEQELTIRQANLDSLLSQQAALASQVAESTISVRMVPSDLLEANGAPVIGEPSLWEDITTALGNAWSGFVVFIAYTSPLWVLTLIILGAVWEGVRVQKRRRTRQSVAAAEKQKAAEKD